MKVQNSKITLNRENLWEILINKPHSSRNKKLNNKQHSTKNYRSARDTGNTYSNYLSSEPLSKLSLFNNLLGKHGPKRSIDTTHGISSGKGWNLFKLSKNESAKISRKSSSKNSQIYGYENQYSSNMYTNEYSNSAQTSQFTFGPGPDSRISDFVALPNFLIIL